MPAPKTYWEVRCAATENFVEAMLDIIRPTLPPEHQDRLVSLWNSYADYINSIPEEGPYG